MNHIHYIICIVCVDRIKHIFRSDLDHFSRHRNMHKTQNMRLSCPNCAGTFFLLWLYWNVSLITMEFIHLTATKWAMSRSHSTRYSGIKAMNLEAILPNLLAYLIHKFMHKLCAHNVIIISIVSQSAGEWLLNI